MNTVRKIYLQLQKSSFIALFLSLSLLSCKQTQQWSVPEDRQNPWVDDYTHSSSMEHYKEWGTYNVHDPAIKKFGDYYYIYTTDAIFAENRKSAQENDVPLGNIQIRKSKDLIDWEFVGWAFSDIPQDAVDWVHANNNGSGATNIWAPYVIKQGNNIDFISAYLHSEKKPHGLAWPNLTLQRDRGNRRVQ